MSLPLRKSIAISALKKGRDNFIERVFVIARRPSSCDFGD